MNDKEILRLGAIRDVCENRIRRVDAARILSISVRQVQRLVTRFRQFGAAGLVHKRRGKPSSNKISDNIRCHCLNLLHQYYSDFGPTLAHEKLSELHGMSVSLETLRQWLIADGLWVPHAKRKPRVYQPRHRRDCLGERIQIDGSHHDWFEGRSAKCCLLVYIDDATGRLMNLRFSETESAFDYMVATREYLAQHGKPTALYSDRHAVFHVSKRDAQSDRLTQFGRVLNDLNIELICANSSQAKGRVERANKTLQDRLVKEMRLQGINTIEQANAWLPDFIADFNRRFAKPPRYPKDMHRPDGTIAIQYGRRKLEFKIFDKLADIDQGQVVDNKRLGAVLKFAQAKQEEFEQQQKRDRSKKAPKRTAQQRAIRQLEQLNPVLIHPGQFKAGSRKKP